MWQYLVQSWLRQQAQTALHDALTSAATSPAPTQDAAPVERRPADVGLVFALSIESGGLVDQLDGAISTLGAGWTVRQGGWRGRNLALIESGAGREAASRATAALLEGHRPAWVISTGFAGGLRPGIARGDIVIANSVCDASGARLAIDFKWSAGASPPGVHVGRMLTVARIIRSPPEKHALGEQHDALAVDMETLAVAQVCAQEKVRFLAVRIISDAVDDELPADLEQLMTQRGWKSQLGAAAAAIWKRPSSVKDLWRLHETALVSSDRLAKFLLGMIGQISPRPGPDPTRDTNTPGA